MINEKPLVRTSHPYLDESFLGYITRLTELNHYDNKTWVLRLSRIHQNLLQPRNSFVFNNAIDMRPLSHLTRVKKETLSSLLYPYAPPRSCYFFGHKISQFLIRPRFPKICPTCLRASNYCRKIWDLATITVCPLHKCLLIDTCPLCGKRINWNRRKVSGCICDLDWREITPVSIEGPSLGLAAQIYTLCGLHNMKPHTREFEESPLFSLNFESLMSALLLVSSQLNGAEDTKGRFLSSPWSLTELHMQFEETLAVFTNWPESYFKFLEWRRTQPNSLKTPSAIEKDFGAFYKLLYKRAEESSLGFMQTAFEDYINSHWDGGLLPLRMRIKKNRVKIKYIGKTEATKLLGVEHNWVEKFINDGRLKGIIRDEGKQRVFLVERRSVELLKKAFDESLTLQEVMSQLGVGKHLISRLVEGEFLKALRGPTLDNYPGWKFDQNSVNDFLTKINNLPLAENRKLGKTLTFEQAIKALIGASVYVGDLINAIFSGLLDARRKESIQGLPSLVFDQPLISAFINSHVRSQGSSLVLSIKEAARLLRAQSRTIRFLISRKIVPSHKEFKGKWTRRQIFRKDVEAFAQNYILPSQIAPSFKTSSQIVSKLLLGHGLKPISGPSVDGGDQLVFKKSEVSVLNLTAMILEERLRSNPNRLMRSADVAELLGIDERQVYNLVYSRSLRPCLKVDDETKMKFTLASVEKYKRRLLSGLVTFGEAAKMMGTNLMSFRSKWIYTGRLKPAKIEVRGKVTYYYLWRKDVEAIVEFHTATLDVREAAEMLGINIWNVDRCLKRTKMKAVSGPLVDGLRKKRYLRTDIKSLLNAMPAAG